MEPTVHATTAQETLPPIRDFFFTKTTKNTYVRVDSKDILYVHAAGSSVEIITRSQKLILSANLLSFCQQFPHPSLLRVHRSFVVNISQVDLIEDNFLRLGSHAVPIGRSYRELVAQFLFRLQAD